MKHFWVFLLLSCLLPACDSAKPPEASHAAPPDPTPAPVQAAAPEPAPEPAPAPAPPVEKPGLIGMPDVGKTEHVSVTAKGIGLTPDAAMNDALKNAIMQVNGAIVATPSAEAQSAKIVLSADPQGQFFATGYINDVPVRFLVDTGATVVSLGANDARRIGIDPARGVLGISQTANGPIEVSKVRLDSVRVGDIVMKDVEASVSRHDEPEALLGMSFLNRVEMHRSGNTMTLQETPRADQIVAKSNGVISSLKIVNIARPEDEGDPYIIDIEAAVAKYAAPADSGKIRIVISPLRSQRRTFDIGGHGVPARIVLDAIRQRLVDALTQTGRFTVLDREFDAEIQGELDLIMSGETPKNDLAKLGQALSADLIWVGDLRQFAYTRRARQLRASDRELVSYSGGWSMSQRLINAATRQIQQSTLLQGSAPSTTPTTLHRGIDSMKILSDMQADLVQKAAESVLLRTFPISIIDRTGKQVVLSQGGAVLREKSRYRVYALGRELKDPQTGQSLGHMESPCCDLTIDRVMPSMAYATLDNVRITLDDQPPGSLLLREPLPPQEQAVTATPTRHPPAPKPAKKGKAPETQKRDDW